MNNGREAAGKTAVAGIKDRDTNRVNMEAVDYVDRDTLEPLVLDSIDEGTRVYTDDASVYDNIPNHESVKHSIGEFVRGDVDTNSIESQFALLKHGIYGTCHHISPKHTHR